MCAEVVEWPVTKRDVFTRMGIRPPRGVLMHGPPGCSKTLVAKALANGASAGFVSVKGPELFSKWVGESEKAISELFRVARAAAPTIVFFDEIDAIGGERGSTTSGVGDRVLSQLLMEIDGVEPADGVIVLGATNRPDRLDKALLRPGRFDRLVFVGPPVGDEVREVLDVYLNKVPLEPSVDRAAIARRLEGYTGAEIAAVCREAGLQALRAGDDTIGQRHLERAAAEIEPQVTDASLEVFRAFNEASGRAVNAVPRMGPRPATVVVTTRQSTPQGTPNAPKHVAAETAHEP
jgi:SpoVK/Ycf46/Vps4 family AAA+-type ATPase